MPFHASATPATRRTRLLFWGGLVLLGALLVWAGRVRPHWPWFSMWLWGVLLGLGILGTARARRALGLSWFGVTLFTLTGVCLANLFLFSVESHRQRSERLEVHGVWFTPGPGPLRLGVGRSGLDVRFASEPTRLDRWSLAVRPTSDSTFALDEATGVEMIRVRAAGARLPWRGWRSALGHTLTAGAPLRLSIDGAPSEIGLEPGGVRGTLTWSGRSAPLARDDPLLDRLLARRLREGLRISELAWDTLPDRRAGDDLVLTMVRSERRMGRLLLQRPVFRIVSRRDPDLGPDGLRVARGDTVQVTSRGRTWAFSLDRVAGLSRLAAPLAVRFVEGPRPTGWALPSAEACGADADRCGILATGALPPPQPHFDLSGFGLDTTRYELTARLESDTEEVRLVGADAVRAFPYGTLEPVPARARSADAPAAGWLFEVHRAASARQSAVLLTVLGLYVLFVAALLTVLGNPALAEQLRTDAPTPTAAWSLLNLFLVFLGIRLSLGLRVAYATPFYDRAAATAVGLWLTFATLLVLLARWGSWTPAVWRLVRWMERPLARRLLPGRVAEAAALPPSRATTPTGQPRRTVLSRLALVVFVGTGAALVWQRPEAGLGLLVAAVAILAWLTLGLFGRRAGRGPLRPLDVLTADADSPRPLRTFGVAAAAAVGLAVTMQAPIVALGPVLVLLFAFSLSMVLERRWGPAARPRAAGVLYALLALALLTGLWFAGGVGVPVLVTTAALLLVLALWSGRGRGGAPARLVTAHGALLELGRSTLSGVGWVGVLAVLGVLTFLGFQEIPPFARFALVFMLFLLAVRAGLACRRVLDEGGSPFGALALLTIPAGVLLVFMLFDFGLGLVFFLPMMTTVLLATRIDRLPVPLAAGSAVLLLVVLLAAASVLRPSRTDLRSATDVAGFSDAFANLGNGFVDGLRATGLTVPVTRATVRGLAATDPALVEEALAWAGPSEALFAAAPSLEQVWGGRAYASAGWTGSGLAGTTSLGRGVPIVVSYAENAFSVYVLSEHGALGGLSVLFAYLALLLVVARWLWSVRAGVADTPEGLAVLALTVGSVLWLALPAAYVGASNLGLVPLTGQNMPFLGLNSWADVMLVSGIGTGAFIVLAGLGPTLAPPAGGEARP